MGEFRRMIRKIALFTCLFLLYFGIETYAHSGRTDANGGHNCSEKSQAKGLCSGYHYHNGGGTSSEGSSKSSNQPSATKRNDKDCADFATYDEVVAYWNSKGYSATNDPENLDGWGNGQVDDGIPCEAPSNYDKTKINNSSEQIQYKQTQVDTANGEKQGYNQGLKDGYDEKEASNVPSSGSSSYKSGFTSGYDKGYQEGQNKIKADKMKANNDGYQSGKKQNEIKIPDAYSVHQGLKKSFEDGFHKAVEERVEAKKKEYSELGYKDGKSDLNAVPKNIEPVFIQSYEEGFKLGQKELKDVYYKKGYEAAFTMLTFKNPNLSNEKFTKWYQEGFKSNQEVQKIKEQAYSLGKNGDDYAVPSKFKKGEVIFKHSYQKGYEEYEDEQQQKQATLAGGFGMALIGWLSRRFYVAKKMIR